MTEMNELTRSLVRVEELINGKQYQGAINLLWIAQNHALSAVKLIKDQSSAMTEQSLKIKELTERMADWQKRAVSAEAEINELDEQEPVVWSWKCDSGSIYNIYESEVEAINDMETGGEPIPLYSRPAPAKSVPDGFAIVSIEPTPEMLIAARDWSITKNGAGVGNDQATGCYKAMITAAKGE